MPWSLCAAMWRLRTSRREKDLWQEGQRYGRSRVWILMCRTRCSCLPKARPQMSHTATGRSCASGDVIAWKGRCRSRAGRARIYAQAAWIELKLKAGHPSHHRWPAKIDAGTRQRGDSQWQTEQIDGWRSSQASQAWDGGASAHGLRTSRQVTTSLISINRQVF